MKRNIFVLSLVNNNNNNNNNNNKPLLRCLAAARVLNLKTSDVS
jgi:hypothetical protein